MAHLNAQAILNNKTPIKHTKPTTPEPIQQGTHPKSLVNAREMVLGSSIDVGAGRG